MRNYQFFIPCTGGVDTHEHNVYCGCENQGVGTEVFPKSWKHLEGKMFMDLSNNQVIYKVDCEVLDKSIMGHGSCVFCSEGEITSTTSTLKKADGTVFVSEDAYGTCNYCGSI